jgi:type IV pilus assembly protein PilY1
VNGDDAVEFIIDGGDEVFDDVDDTVVAGYYGGHGADGGNSYNGTIFLSAGQHKFQFRHEEVSGGDSYYLSWELSSDASEIEDFVVRVKVADSTVGLEANCKQYPNGEYKPVGLLQRHGESNSMYFGLLSGSYTKNTSGGVLRKKIGSITDEIVANTGQFTAVNGIVKTIDKFRIVDFSYGDYSYNSNCGWITTRPISEGECRMWGNPVGEMMYETLRYFAGEGSPTSDFTYADANDNHAGLDLTLPKATWNDPYDTGDGGFEYCAKPFMLVLSDINPTFDSDQLPGAFSEFGSQSPETIGNAGSSLDVEDLADDIFSAELSDGNRFIGQQGTTVDGACTEKTIDGFGDIRGLCPEEPTKQGSYYSAAVAKYGWNEDLHTVSGKQRVRTYAVGLASPLPRIEIPLNGKTITLVPFAKSVNGDGIESDEGKFQPTNTIVDFFIEELYPHYGRFRINYEDVEQGADHDMDAIVLYEYTLVDAAGVAVDASTIGNAVALDITLTSEYAAGGIDQHMGYIISGTETDGIYLEVKDVGGGNVNYFLDTPNIAADLPFTTTRRFTADPAGGSLSAGLLTNPLWYAAKWGGFDDENNNDIPDLTDEWDKDGDGNPDTYFYVVNPLKLEEQLNKSFADILEKAASGTAASVLATNSEGEGNLVQAYFKPRVSTGTNDLTWLGYLQSLWVDPWGNLREDTDSDGRMDLTNSSDGTGAADVDKVIVYTTDSNGDTQVIRYTNHYLYDPRNGLNGDCYLGYLTPAVTCPDPTDSNNYELVSINQIVPIFEAGDMLRQRSADSRKIFTFIDGDGEDSDSDLLIDESGENEGGGPNDVVGQVLSPATDSPFDNNSEVINFHQDNLAKLRPFLGLKDSASWTYLDPSTGFNHDTRARNLINYIRGKDSADLVGSPDTRTRTFDDGTVWKLGDIINSTPVSISKAPDYYHLIYGDESFQAYLDYTENRETVIYVGANDGMLHAFTSWKYNNGQYTQVASTTEGLGDELWAYVPQTLLPHLKFLAAPDYAHTFYVDLKPKLFDARIFPTSDRPPGRLGDHFAGRTEHTAASTSGPKTTSMAMLPPWKRVTFIPPTSCMDVTDPREPPLVVGALLRGSGHEHIVSGRPCRRSQRDQRIPPAARYTWTAGNWMVAFGSGPTDYDGSSSQPGYMFVVDLLKTGQPFPSTDGTGISHDWLFTTGTNNTLMNSPVAFDKSLTYNVDGIYFGSIADAGSPSLEGKMYQDQHPYGGQLRVFHRISRVHLRRTRPYGPSPPCSIPPAPITASVSLSTDQADNVWAFFGTGRYQSTADKMPIEPTVFFWCQGPLFQCRS